MDEIVELGSSIIKTISPTVDIDSGTVLNGSDKVFCHTSEIDYYQ